MELKRINSNTNRLINIFTKTEENVLGKFLMEMVSGIITSQIADCLSFVLAKITKKFSRLWAEPPKNQLQLQLEGFLWKKRDSSRVIAKKGDEFYLFRYELRIDSFIFIHEGTLCHSIGEGPWVGEG